MARFIYVQAMALPPFSGPGDLSFDHVEIEADDASTAYIMGQRVLTAFKTAKPDGAIINDYVIEARE